MPRSDPRVGPEISTHGAGSSRPAEDQWWTTDAFLVDDGLAFYGIATGFAEGHDAGRIARESLDAVSGYIDAWRADTGVFGSPESPSMVMNEAFEYANDELHQLRRIEPACRAVGVTMSAIWFVAGLAVVGHVGDARVHRLRGIDLRRLTHDHVEHRMALTRCLGVHAAARPEVWRERVAPGDRYLVGSPALHASVEADETLAKALRRGADGAIEALGDVRTYGPLTAVAVECSGTEVPLLTPNHRADVVWGSWASA